MAEKKISREVESPNVMYTISAAKLTSILRKSFETQLDVDFFGVRGDAVYDQFADFFTRLITYETPIQTKPKKHPSKKDDTSQPLPFKSLTVNALFLLRGLSKNARYRYYKIKISKSKIPGAGYGAFAVDTIPKGAKGIYKGVARTEDASNNYYSWTVKSFDRKTGLPDDSDDILFYIDACELDTSNWTRFVNCGRYEKDNNIIAHQLFTDFFYQTTRKIKPKEELETDYGKRYREMILGWVDD